jgi:type III pantothenate kinase
MSDCFLLLDQGNTRLKFRFVSREGEVLQQGSVFNAELPQEFPEFSLHPVGILMVSSGPSVFDPASIWPGIISGQIKPEDAEGINWAYSDLNNLGRDRMAALMGARSLFPGSNLVVADAGTCLTVDYLTSEGEHLGGFISPGYQMRLQAMHTFTDALPLINRIKPDQLFPGKSTEDCMETGALAGLIAELEWHFRQGIFHSGKAEIRILTGGDAKDLAHHLKESTFVAEDLIFRGLYQACLRRYS